MGNEPRSTATLARGKIFAMTVDGTLAVLDQRNGALLRKASTTGKHSRPHKDHGTAGSPLVFDQVLLRFACRSCSEGELAVFFCC